MKRITKQNLKAMTLLSWVLVLFIWSGCEEKKKQRITLKPRAELKFETPDALKTNLVYSPKTDIVDSFFTGIHLKNGFNGTVLVTDKDKVIYKRAFGYADFTSHDTLTDNSIFQLASVSKQFTAVAIMMLKERGVIAYNDDVKKYYPEFPYAGITIKMLLSHRSGLPNYMNFCEEFQTDKKKILNNQDMMGLMIKNKPPVYFPPDKKFNYCNTNYCILAAIVEKTSKVTFSDFIETNIFKPLGMRYSFVGNRGVSKYIDYVVWGHDENNQKIAPDFMDGILGDKGVYSCLSDLYIWDQALYTNKIISQTTLQEALKPANNDMIGGRNYGYGWRIKNLEDGTPLYYHGGWWKGFNIYSMRNPKDHSSIIILSNKVNWSFNNITSFIPRFYNQKKTQEPETI